MGAALSGCDLCDLQVELSLISVGVLGLPLPGGSAHLFNAVLGFPAHLVPGLLGVCVAGGNVAGATGVHDVGQFLAAGLLIGVENVQHAVALAGTQVAHKEAAVLGHLLNGGHMAPGQIHHMDVIPDAGAIGGGVVSTKDVELFQLAHGYLGDIGHQVVGDAVGVLADETTFVGADGVEVAQQSHVQGGIGLAVVHENLLDEQLGGTIGIGGAAGGEVLTDGHRGGIAVHGGGGGEYKVLHVVGPHGVEQHQGAGEVVGVVFQGLGNALTHGLETGEVDDRINVGVLVEDLLHGGCIAQVCLHKGNGGASDLLHAMNGLGAGVDEIVHDDNVVAGLNELHTSMAADIPGAAADEN